MRIATWNCRSGTDTKIGGAIERLQPDILVAPESSRHPAVAAGSLLNPPVPHAWTGSHRTKGLGIFAPGCEAVEIVDGQPGPGEWGLAVRAHGAANVVVLGVWTLPAATSGDGGRYQASLSGVIDRHQSILDKGDAVVAGDFNCPGPTTVDRFGRFVDQLHDRYGLVSAYHHATDEPIGRESQFTHWWRGHPDACFHIDFVLVLQHWTIVHVAVGTYAEWAAPTAELRSDHAPVVVDLTPPSP